MTTYPARRAHLASRPITNTDPQADNDTRASRGMRALREYTLVTGGDGNDPETQVSDLLSDLLHLCDALGLDADAVKERAQMYYVAELRGEP